MIASRRWAVALLGIVAMVLVAVIAVRLSDGTDPPPRDTTPVVIPPSSTPSPVRSGAPRPIPIPTDDDDGDDDDSFFDSTVPAPRDYDGDADDPDDPDDPDDDDD